MSSRFIMKVVYILYLFLLIYYSYGLPAFFVLLQTPPPTAKECCCTVWNLYNCLPGVIRLILQEYMFNPLTTGRVYIVPYTKVK